MTDDLDLDARDWPPISACAGHFPALYESHPMPKPLGASPPYAIPSVSARPSELRSAERLNPGKPRKYPEPIVGMVVGPWTVTRIIGRGWRGRSDLRIEARCSCGRLCEMYEAYMRVGVGCRHGT